MKDIAKFESDYNSSHEKVAQLTRELFVKKFPKQSLIDLTVDEYVVGWQKQTFCNLVESGTKEWANIQAGTALKFGIYFGKTKSDPTRKYRFSEKFGTNEKAAFAAVKSALIELVTLGSADSPDFAKIDKNLLSQMFRAKILSLYYPDRFLAVCSSEHLGILRDSLGLPANLPCSQYQNLLLRTKYENLATRQWSEPKFMVYLYRIYLQRSDCHRIS